MDKKSENVNGPTTKVNQPTSPQHTIVNTIHNNNNVSSNNRKSTETVTSSNNKEDSNGKKECSTDVLYEISESNVDEQQPGRKTPATTFQNVLGGNDEPVDETSIEANEENKTYINETPSSSDNDKDNTLTSKESEPLKSTVVKKVSHRYTISAHTFNTFSVSIE